LFPLVLPSLFPPTVLIAEGMNLVTMKLIFCALTYLELMKEMNSTN
jgi:hypothetical protein